MANMAQVERLVLDLSEKQRALLAARLLESLPPVLYDEDEGIAEALRRDAEIDADPTQAETLEQLDEDIRRRSS
jgi:putative addiction module component (TIGR02574 family)